MRRSLVLVFMVVVGAIGGVVGGACNRGGDGELPVAARAARHTGSARVDALNALTEGLNEAYLSLKDAPADRARALSRARHAVEKFYLPDEAAAFELYVGDNVWMLYIPVAKAPTVWLARDREHLLTEVAQLPAEAKAKIGL